jgi:hypothetical protein
MIAPQRRARFRGHGALSAFNDRLRPDIGRSILMRKRRSFSLKERHECTQGANGSNSFELATPERDSRWRPGNRVANDTLRLADNLQLFRSHGNE